MSRLRRINQTAAGAVLLAGLLGCTERDGGPRPLDPAALDPKKPAVVNLGNLRTGKPPSKAAAELAEFLFGAAPEPPLGLIRPIDVTPAGAALAVCDSALAAVLAIDANPALLYGAALDPAPARPAALCAAENGDLLVADALAGAVLRYNPAGRQVVQYRLGDRTALRPGGIACVGDEVWVSNVTSHCIEVFDAAGGEHRRAIGRRGDAHGEFGVPLGMAVLPGGDVAVVDMLGCRVQVLGSDGAWKRDIGGPGDRPGRFGRPKDVACGPDGTIFVTDAAWQRVHAFDPAGQVLLTFGGADSRDDAGLVMPAGICISTAPVSGSRTAPGGFSPSYYVLVAEELHNPGVRVFAWRAGVAAPEPPARRLTVTRIEPRVPNPHWRSDGCTTCHAESAGAPRAIPINRVDALCVNCHDGRKSVADPHPIGRLARGPDITHPQDWPLVGERLSCVTCHEFSQHCTAGAARPRENPHFLRGLDPARPQAFCANCHTASPGQFNPHRVVGQGEACVFCHTSRPPLLSDGRPSGDARLRQEPLQLCLNCHVPHMDPAPAGHLGAAVDGRFRAAAERTAGFAKLPLEGDRVTCATCHNPHAPELFPAGSILAARARRPEGARVDLRLEYDELCLTCHPK